MKSVILFLTSASNLERTELALKNLSQLSKLNKDIIILSTTSKLDKRFYTFAKNVIIDENRNTFSKKLYQKINTYNAPAYTPKNIISTEVINNNNLQVTFFSETNYLNVFKNTKNLITYAISQNYDNFMFIEDDHYFSDIGIKRVKEYFEELNKLNAIYFSNMWEHKVLRSHFWFGNCKYFEESVINNFPESIDDINSAYPYFGMYELFLYIKMYECVYNKDRVKIVSMDENPFEKLFGQDSRLNQIDYVKDILNDINLNILYNNIEQSPNLCINFKDTNLDNQYVDFKIYKDDKIISTRIVNTNIEKVITCPISIDGTIKIQLNLFTKSFKLSLNDVLLNGTLS